MGWFRLRLGSFFWTFVDSKQLSGFVPLNNILIVKSGIRGQNPELYGARQEALGCLPIFSSLTRQGLRRSYPGGGPFCTGHGEGFSDRGLFLFTNPRSIQMAN